MHSFLKAWRLTGTLLSSSRKLWVPFALTMLFELSLVGLLWLAPHPPFSRALAPPIEFFFGDRVLHYPAHLWFLYHAMKHTSLVASILLGAFMTAIACAMVQQLHTGSPLSFRAALVGRQVHYGRVVLLWVIAWALAKGMFQLVVSYGPKVAWMFWAVVVLTVLLQSLVVYAIPVSVFERAVWWKALWRGARQTLRYPISTFITVLVPCAVVIVFSIACSPARVAHWMRETAPELAVAMVAARLMLWMVADLFMTVSIAHLWWVHHAARQTAVLAVSTRRVAVASRTTAANMEGPAVA